MPACAGPELAKIKSGWRNWNDLHTEIAGWHVWYVCVTEWLKPIARTSGPLDHEVLRFISWFGKIEFWVRFRVCFWTLPSLSAHHHIDWSLFGPWWQDRAFSEDTSTTEAASGLHAEARRESFMATMYSHGVWGYHILKTYSIKVQYQFLVWYQFQSFQETITNGGFLNVGIPTSLKR